MNVYEGPPWFEKIKAYNPCVNVCAITGVCLIAGLIALLCHIPETAEAICGPVGPTPAPSVIDSELFSHGNDTWSSAPSVIMGSDSEEPKKDEGNGEEPQKDEGVCANPKEIKGTCDTISVFAHQIDSQIVKIFLIM